MNSMSCGGALRCASPRFGRRIALAFLIAASSAPAGAHEGHDHGADKAAVEIVSLSRASAVSETYQLVAVLDRETLVLTLDRVGSNAPVDKASVAVTLGTENKVATPRPDGSFALSAPELAKPGRHELIVAIEEGGKADLLIMGLDVPEPPSGQAKPRIAADTPARLSDGSVFLPKVTQRLVGLRTAPAAAATIEPATTLVGRIIPDPNRSGVVQSTISGRIDISAGRLPRLGEAVKAGQTLALVTPAFAAIDITNVQQTAGDLDQQIALAQNKVDQFRSLVRSNTLAPERLRTVEIELENLRKRRATLSTSQGVPGQVVTPSDVLFQIVDPRHLWVEALVFETAVPDLLPDATATAGGTQPLKLELIGRSRALQQLSTIIHFAVTDPPPALNIGSPVTVLARTRERIAGLVLPQSAVVTAASGGAVVWVHMEPERFQPRAVKSRSIDGERVLIEAGLSEGDRAVVAAAELLNQVR
jgi:hypothetical protein